MLFEEKKYNENGRDCSSFGAFPSDSKMWFKLVSDRCDIESCRLEIHNDGMTSRSFFITYDMDLVWHEDKNSAFEYGMDFPRLLADCKLSGEGLFYYHYTVRVPEGELVLGGEGREELNLLRDYQGERQLLLYRPDFKTSEAFREGIVYHIFVDRFFRSGKCGVKDGAFINEDWDNGIPQFGAYPGAPLKNNMFFGGDLYGIAEKLDYIASLGTKTIYLSPVFDSPSNHKYDTGDYMTVDEMFGGDGALELLCREARKRNIDIILDGVFNHTGDDSRYFNRYGKYPTPGAYQSKESPFYGWYNFREYPDSYESWWGVEILPRVKSADEGYRRFICRDVVGKWMKAGVSGWRLDVADELSDAFLDDFRTAVKCNNPDGVVLGEVWEDASDKTAYGLRRRYFGGGQLDSVMNYPLKNAVISYILYGDCSLFRAATETLYRRYPKAVSDNLLNFLGTHDTERILTVLGGVSGEDKTNAELSVTFMDAETRHAAAEKLKAAYSVIAGLPGVPCVFYGDEAGTEGYRDPFNRRPFPWSRIDEDLLAHYRKIGDIRKNNKVFRDGMFRIVSLTPEHLMYIREPWDTECDTVTFAYARTGDYPVEFCREVIRLDTLERGNSFLLREGESAYFLTENKNMNI